jgi:hypothetical protein
MATYKHLRSSTANKRPTTSIADGQLAINTNTASPGLFFKDSAGTGIVKVGPVHVGTTAPNSVPASGGSTGNYLGEQWLDTSVSPAQMKVWNGSTWVGVVADELPVSKLQDGAARQLIQTDAAGTGVEWTSNVDVPGTLDVTSTATFDSIAQYPLGSAAAPTLTFTGDNNTGIYSPGADQVAISTGAVERARIDSSGRLLVGTSTARVNVAGFTPSFQVEGTNSSTSSLSLVNNQNNTAGSYLFFSKSRGTTVGSTVVVASGDAIGGIYFSGADGTDLQTAAASIDCVVDGTPGADDMPGRLVFATTADGASSPTERMRITSAGLVGIGTAAPGATLHVEGLGNTVNQRIFTSDNVLNATASLTFGTTPGSRSKAAIRMINSNTGNASGDLSLLTDSGSSGLVSRLYVNSSGNVGIGTTSPSTALDVSGELTFSAGGAGWRSAAIKGIDAGGSFKGELAFYTHPSAGAAVAPFERARIDSSGRLLVGTSNAVTGVNQPQYARLQVVGNTLSGARSGLIALGRSAAASTIVAGDQLGGITFGDNAAGEFAYIFGEADGTAGTNDYPGRLVFSVTADGASSPTEAMRIKNSRILNFANTPTYADNTAAKAGGLVNGDVYRKSDGTLMIVYT